jgi:PST family polysaccharide transporter
MGGQIVLAWFLSRQDFGFISLAYTITCFSGLLLGAGLRDILVQQHAKFDQNENPAFWLNLLLGLATASIMVIVAPFAAVFYHEPRVVGLVMVLAANALVNSLYMVPDVKLSACLRFRLIASIGFAVNLITILSSIIFAMLGFGAYSFVLPLLLGSVAKLVFVWIQSPIRVKRRMEVERWKDFIGDSGILIAATFFLMIAAQGDYVLLGRFQSRETSGVYYWAFNLSLQTFQVIVLNVGIVLFPILAKLRGEDTRLLRAFLGSSEMLAFLAIPAIILQAVCSNAGIHLAFAAKWFPGIPILVILSMGSIPQCISYQSYVLLKVQGRTVDFLKLAAIYALIFLAVVGPAASIFHGIFAATAVSIGILIVNCFVGPWTVYYAIRDIGGTWRDVRHVFARPLTAAMLAGGVTWAVDASIADWNASRSFFFVRLIVATSLMASLYLLIMNRIAPALFHGAADRAKRMVRNRAANVVQGVEGTQEEPVATV